jgi:hypothetical protein
MSPRLARAAVVALLLGACGTLEWPGDPRYSVYVVNERSEDVLIVVSPQEAVQAWRVPARSQGLAARGSIQPTGRLIVLAADSCAVLGEVPIRDLSTMRVLIPDGAAPTFEEGVDLSRGGGHVFQFEDNPCP